MITASMVATILCMTYSLYGDKQVKSCETEMIKSCSGAYIANCLEGYKKYNLKMLPELKKLKDEKKK